MTNKIYTIYIGIGKDKGNKDIHKTVSDIAIKKLSDELTSTYGGCTISNGYGKFTHKAGNIVTEPCVIITVCDMTHYIAELQQSIIKKHINTIKTTLNQESVLLLTSQQTINFI